MKVKCYINEVLYDQSVIQPEYYESEMLYNRVLHNQIGIQPNCHTTKPSYKSSINDNITHNPILKTKNSKVLSANISELM